MAQLSLFCPRGWVTNAQDVDILGFGASECREIAFRSHHDGPADIYAIRIDGSGLRNLTNSTADEWAPAWSPDGKRIAFQTNRDGNWEIYVMNADGTGAENLTHNPADDQLPYWRP